MDPGPLVEGTAVSFSDVVPSKASPPPAGADFDEIGFAGPQADGKTAVVSGYVERSPYGTLSLHPCGDQRSVLLKAPPASPLPTSATECMPIRFRIRHMPSVMSATDLDFGAELLP